MITVDYCSSYLCTHWTQKKAENTRKTRKAIIKQTQTLCIFFIHIGLISCSKERSKLIDQFIFHRNTLRTWYNLQSIEAAAPKRCNNAYSIAMKVHWKISTYSVHNFQVCDCHMLLTAIFAILEVNASSAWALYLSLFLYSASFLLCFASRAISYRFFWNLPFPINRRRWRCCLRKTLTYNLACNLRVRSLWKLKRWVCRETTEICSFIGSFYRFSGPRFAAICKASFFHEEIFSWHIAKLLPAGRPVQSFS